MATTDKTTTTTTTAPKKGIVRVKSMTELGFWYIGSAVVCAVISFVLNAVTSYTISPLYACGFGLLLVLVIHYADLLQKYGL